MMIIFINEGAAMRVYPGVVCLNPNWVLVQKTDSKVASGGQGHFACQLL